MKVRRSLFSLAVFAISVAIFAAIGFYCQMSYTPIDELETTKGKIERVTLYKDSCVFRISSDPSRRIKANYRTIGLLDSAIVTKMANASEVELGYSRVPDNNHYILVTADMGTEAVISYAQYEDWQKNTVSTDLRLITLGSGSLGILFLLIGLFMRKSGGGNPIEKLKDKILEIPDITELEDHKYQLIRNGFITNLTIEDNTQGPVQKGKGKLKIQLFLPADMSDKAKRLARVRLKPQQSNEGMYVSMDQDLSSGFSSRSFLKKVDKRIQEFRKYGLRGKAVKPSEKAVSASASESQPIASENGEQSRPS